MAEESTHIWSSKQRVALFLTAMHHFAQALHTAVLPLHYARLDAPDNHGSLATELQYAIEKLALRAIIL